MLKKPIIEPGFDMSKVNWFALFIMLLVCAALKWYHSNQKARQMAQPHNVTTLQSHPQVPLPPASPSAQ